MKTQCSQDRQQSTFIEEAVLKADRVHKDLTEYVFIGFENIRCSTRSFSNVVLSFIFVMHWRIKKKKKFGKLNSIFRMTVLTAQWSHSSNKTGKVEEKTVKNKQKTFQLLYISGNCSKDMQ